MKNLLEIAKTRKFEYAGIRVIYGPAPEIGCMLPPSHRWEDGEDTGEELPGTCCINVDGNYGHHQYCGDMVVLIGGDRMEYGDDPGEIIIRDAVVLGVAK